MPDNMPSAAPLQLPAAVLGNQILVANIQDLNQQAFVANEAACTAANGNLNEYWNNKGTASQPEFPKSIVWQRLDVNKAIVAFYATQAQFAGMQTVTAKETDAIISENKPLDPGTVSVSVNPDNTMAAVLHAPEVHSAPAVPNVMNPIGFDLGTDSMGHEWYKDASVGLYAAMVGVVSNAKTDIGGSTYRFHVFSTPFSGGNEYFWEMLGTASSLPPLTPKK